MIRTLDELNIFENYAAHFGVPGWEIVRFRHMSVLILNTDYKSPI